MSAAPERQPRIGWLLLAILICLVGTEQRRLRAQEVPAAETHFLETGRGDLHSPGWAELMALKGEPLAPRFPRVGTGIERHLLDNGLVVYLAEDHKLPLVRMELLFPGGSAFELKRRDSGRISMMASQLTQGGTRSHSPEELEDTLALLAARLGSRAGRESGSVTLDLLTKDLEIGLDLFAQVILEPAFDQERIERSGRQRGAGGGRGGGRGGSGRVLVQEFRRLLYGAGHPLLRDNGAGEGRGGRRARFTRDQLIETHQTFLRPQGSFLSVVGDFDAGEMLARIEQRFGGWTSPAEPLPEPETMPGFAEPIAGIQVIDRPVPQSSIMIGHLGIDRNEPRRFAVALMNDILGGGSFSSRITERIRSDEGLAYQASSRFGIDTRETGLFTVQLQTKTESTARAIRLVLEEIRKMRQPGTVSQNEFETARESRLYSQALQFTRPAANVVRLMRREMDGQPADLDEIAYQAIRGVTRQQIEAAARDFLKPDQLLICVLGDLEAIRESLAEIGPVTELVPAPPRGRRNRGG